MSSLMLLLLAMGDREGLQTLSQTAGKWHHGPKTWYILLIVSDCLDARLAVEKGQNNIAFATLLQLGDTKGCADLLVKTDRAPEAALFARTYAPR